MKVVLSITDSDSSSGAGIQADLKTFEALLYQEEKSARMDDILKATLECFDVNYSSDYGKSLPILQFFREIGITSLDDETFKTAFLH